MKDAEGTSSHIAAGMCQSADEWANRNRVLADSLAELIHASAQDAGGLAVEVGCQQGQLTDGIAERTPFDWSGIDPAISDREFSSGGRLLQHGYAHSLPLPDDAFACVLFANVYEHVDPTQRGPSMVEILRIVKPGGVVVGQLPNPYFPIESHSRLPFMGWLPERLQKPYWRLSPAPWDHDFYVVTIRHLRRTAEEAGFRVEMTRKFNYPLEVIPESVRWAARLLEAPMRIVPWAWQFVLRKPSVGNESP
ncbi:MAG: class I SAM-dependent methyltransferase [Thermoleophilia bacterium]|nr:class I SAM-dependent methyltransferase [Thermoleophilia bacterium]